MISLRENIELVQSRIENACRKSGRRVDEIKLIAVSKTVSPEIINKAAAIGIKDFGENKAQELMSKIDKVTKDIRFHMIGHLQTNKVKYIVGNVESIQSIDSIKLAKEINKRAVDKNLKLNTLIQIHTAKEETKFGFDENELEDFLTNVSEMKNISFNGLMTIGTFTDDEKEIRRCFMVLRNLRDKFSAYKTENVHLEELSMGMTNDYQIAIEEGATILRIGTAIFGERNYYN